ncbi:MAG TPA: hypothetical protein VGC73_01875 [Pyrinomonadaceae bacterium]|jgi:hypothetical protein
MRFTVYPETQARTAVTIVHVGFDPLLWSEVGPVAVGLITTLHADDPLGLAIV